MARQSATLKKIERTLARSRQRKAAEVLHRINQLRDKITKETGQWDSVRVIRAMREGR